MSASLVTAWGEAKRRLQAAGIESPVIDARLLVESAAGARRADILTDPHRLLTDAQRAELESHLARREAREPVSHILGFKDFWKIRLKVTPRVLTPRPDTETILDVVLPLFDPAASFQMLDLGVGSGALMLAILKERPGGRGVGVDRSEAALAVARENAALLELSDRAEFRLADWAQGLPSERFDLVVSNPPYVPTGDIAGLDPEVRDHEPRLAIDGGPDGLDAHRRLAAQILRVLREGGVFAVEIGPEQAVEVQALFLGAGGDAIRIVADIAGRPRVVTGIKKALGKEPASG